MEQFFDLPELEVEDRPKGKFFSGSFFWVSSIGNRGIAEEWGKMWAENIFPSKKEASYRPLYMPTGLTRNA